MTAITFATSVLVTAIMAHHGRGSAPPSSELPACHVAARDAFDRDELVLALLWQERHPGKDPPRCRYPDPAVRLVANLDDTPGDEHVIANLTFGIAMFSATGELLGVQDPEGCSEWGNGQLHLSARQFLVGGHAQLVVQTRLPRNCGTTNSSSVLARSCAALVPILVVDDDALARLVDHGEETDPCLLESQVVTTITVLHPGAAVVHLDGRYRLFDGGGQAAPWQRVHNACQIEVNADGNFAVLMPGPGDDCSPYDSDP